MEYIKGEAEQAATILESALSKVFGILDADESLVHIDHTVRESKQNFLKLHEAGHYELPTHRWLFRVFQDCEKTLDPATRRAFSSARRITSHGTFSSKVTNSGPYPPNRILG